MHRMLRKVQERRIQDRGILSFQQADIGDSMRACRQDIRAAGSNDLCHMFLLLYAEVDGRIHSTDGDRPNVLALRCVPSEFDLPLVLALGTGCVSRTHLPENSAGSMRTF